MRSGPETEPVGVLAVVGPTGVGKTALAVALAADLPVEAVSVDSRQVFRGMDIATGKPTPAERRQLPHQVGADQPRASRHHHTHARPRSADCWRMLPDGDVFRVPRSSFREDGARRSKLWS